MQNVLNWAQSLACDHATRLSRPASPFVSFRIARMGGKPRRRPPRGDHLGLIGPLGIAGPEMVENLVQDLGVRGLADR